MPPSGAEAARPQSPLRGILPQSPIRIKQDGKFYERLLTKESAAANPSFRYYCAESGSVPFVWETQPGTPRVDVAGMSAGTLPAITPPPSYLLRHGSGKVVPDSRHPKSKAKSSKKKRYRFKQIKIGFIAGIFRRLTLGVLWRRSAPSPVKVSSSSRWLFSERGQQQHHHGPDHAVRKSAALCSGPRPSPWMLWPFRGIARSRDDGWA